MGPEGYSVLASSTNSMGREVYSVLAAMRELKLETQKMTISEFTRVTRVVTYQVEISTASDPSSKAKKSGASGAKKHVHIGIQQRNGKKSLTTVQGLREECSYETILKNLKKECRCDGNVVQDKELGKVIQLQGDQHKKVYRFLVTTGLVKKDRIKIHGS